MAPIRTKATFWVIRVSGVLFTASDIFWLAIYGTRVVGEFESFDFPCNTASCFVALLLRGLLMVLSGFFGRPLLVSMHAAVAFTTNGFFLAQLVEASRRASPCPSTAPVVGPLPFPAVLATLIAFGVLQIATLRALEHSRAAVWPPPRKARKVKSKPRKKPKRPESLTEPLLQAHVAALESSDEVESEVSFRSCVTHPNRSITTRSDGLDISCAVSVRVCVHRCLFLRADSASAHTCTCMHAHTCTHKHVRTCTL